MHAGGYYIFYYSGETPSRIYLKSDKQPRRQIVLTYTAPISRIRRLFRAPTTVKAYLVQIGATAATVRTISIDQPNEHSLAGARAMANRQLLAEFDKAYKEASGAPGPRTVRFVILDLATGGVKIELDVPKAAVKPQRRGTRRSN